MSNRRKCSASSEFATELGTDTAWTFEPLGPEYGRKALRDAGWDGTTPVLAVCPINPFWWPVKPSLAKWIAHSLTGAYKKSHYRTHLFSSLGPRCRRRVREISFGDGAGVEAYRKSRTVFPVLVAMEMLDQDACERIAESWAARRFFPPTRFTMYEMVSILRACDRMLSSRFHAIVTSMPAGVPSAGVTMDERIRNLMRERGHEHLLMRVDDPRLADKIVAALRALDAEQEEIRDAMGRTVARNLQLMARMGVYFEEQVARRYPEFPFAPACSAGKNIFRRSARSLRLLETHSGVLAA